MENEFGIAIADNQLSGIRAYADAEIVLYAGDIRENREQMADRVIQMAAHHKIFHLWKTNFP